MSSPKVLFGFHAVGVRLKTAPQSIVEIYFESTRRDARMRQFIEKAQEAGVRLIEADSMRLAKLAGSHGHQGVAARVEFGEFRFNDRVPIRGVPAEGNHRLVGVTLGGVVRFSAAGVGVRRPGREGIFPSGRRFGAVRREADGDVGVHRDGGPGVSGEAESETFPCFGGCSCRCGGE